MAQLIIPCFYQPPLQDQGQPYTGRSCTKVMEKHTLNHGQLRVT